MTITFKFLLLSLNFTIFEGLKLLSHIQNFIKKCFIFSYFWNANKVFVFSDVSIHLGFPHYNSDNYLKITLSGHSDSDALEFAVSISIFKNDLKYTDAECKVSEYDSETIVWQLPFGYPNNAKCSYNLLVESNTEVQMHALINLESHADFITYYEFDDVKNVSTVLSQGDSTVRFFPNDDGSQRKVIFEFISDANIQTGGFKLTFKTIGIDLIPSGSGLSVFDLFSVRFKTTGKRTFRCRSGAPKNEQFGVGPVSLRCRSGVGPVSVRCRSGVGPVSVRCLSGVGPVSVRCTENRTSWCRPDAPITGNLRNFSENPENRKLRFHIGAPKPGDRQLWYTDNTV